MFQHLLGGVLLKVDQFKQLDPVPLRGEDQLVLLSVEAHFEGDLVKDQVQSIFHLGHNLRATGVILVLVHHLAQCPFHFGKGFPPVLCPLPEALRELRQGNAFLARINQFFGIRVIRAGLQRLFKVPKGAPLLVQIVIGIAHAEVPVVVAFEVFLMGLQQSNRLFEHILAAWLIWVCQIVISPGQLTVHLRSAFLGGDGLQRVNDLLVFVVFMPPLALL